MKVFKFAAGMAVGYVLGSRAGRDKYEQIAAAARKAQDHPAVAQVQQKAKELLGTTSDASAVTPAPASPAPSAASPGRVPGPPRRQPKSTTTVPETATSPLV